MSKKSTLMLGVFTVVLLLVMLGLVSLSGVLSEVEAAVPPVDTNGSITEDSTEGEIGGDVPGGSEMPPEDDPVNGEETTDYVSYTRADFEVRSPIFTMGTIGAGMYGGIGFRAFVSDAYKEALDNKSATLHVIISPYDTIMKVDASAAYVDWVEELKALDSSVDYTAYQIVNVVNGFVSVAGDYFIIGRLINIKYNNVNTVMVGIPYVQYSDGTRHYAYVPEDDSYKTIARSYAYLCSEAYTNMVCDDMVYSDIEISAFQEGLLKSVNLASGKAEAELDSTLQFTLSLDTIVKTLKVGEVLELVKTFEPEIELYYTWRIANDDIVSLYDGLVIASAIGNTSVTVHMGDLTATCVVSVIDDTCETVTCEYCKHLYYPGDVDACPCCGLRAYEMYLSCDSEHCDGDGFKATIYKTGDGRFWRGDTAVTCEACNCIWNYNRDTELFEIGYHCIYDATHMEDRTGTCSCCGSAMTWQVECNYDGDWLSDEVEAYCAACECLYTVVLPNGGGLAVKMHCDACAHYVICQHCTNEYCTAQNGVCPDCGAVIQQKSIVCHCESAVVIEWTYVNGVPIADCPAAECPDCSCMYVLNSLDLAEALYDCRVDIGVITEDHSITCTCCTVTVPFEIQVNCFGTYVQEEIYLNCSGCTCRYAVSVGGNTYTTARVYNCNGYGIVTHPETREGACVHCAEILTWTIQCKPNGTWNGANVAVTCGDCGCKFKASGNGSELTRTYDCILDARILKTKSAACAHCNVTISWQTYFNGADQWHSDSVIVECSTCYCVYSVGGNGDTLVLVGDQCYFGGQCVHCAADLLLEDHCCTVCGAEHSSVKVRCECCSEYITYFIGYNNEGDRVMPYDVACPTCDCLYSVSGADCDELIKKQNH